MFEQLDDPKLAGRKSWKERIAEGAVILVVSAAVIGVLIYALIGSRFKNPTLGEEVVAAQGPIRSVSGIFRLRPPG